jgi:hypothetical protein
MTAVQQPRQSSAEDELPLTGVERSLDVPTVNAANVGEVV